MNSAGASSGQQLKKAIKDEARRLGFVLAGVTTPDPPAHADVFEEWLAQERHAGMAYMADARSVERRKDPRLLLPECKSILVLAVPYSSPPRAPESGETTAQTHGRTAAYAWGADYHRVLPERLQSIVRFIEERLGQKIRARTYTDGAPILERELAQRAGLGWIGKNSCLIHPGLGSYVLLAEIFLDLELQPDAPLTTDHCGTCTRCIEACPTSCIMPDRTLDSGRCISYLTIESRQEIPAHLRAPIGTWVFGCDICQMVCPWNRFAPARGDPDLGDHDPLTGANLLVELELTSQDFEKQYQGTPLKRAKLTGYRRNVAVVVGNTAGPSAVPALQAAMRQQEPLVAQHAAWAIERIQARTPDNE